MRALGRLKNLEYLDGVQVTDEEMTTALKMAAASRPSSFAILAHARTDQSKPRTLSLVPTAQAILASSQNRPVKLQDDDSQWFIKVLVKMSNLCKQCQAPPPSFFCFSAEGGLGKNHAASPSPPSLPPPFLPFSSATESDGQAK